VDWNPESTLKWNPETTKFGIGNPDVGNQNPVPLRILLHGMNGFKWLFFDFHKNSVKQVIEWSRVREYHCKYSYTFVPVG